MEHYAGLDVSLELASVCVVDAQGEIVREMKVASEPEALNHQARVEAANPQPTQKTGLS